ncbi:MAG: hypothetical protein J1E38_04545 [Paramuribaculum sp.]|nr:hypothetical protein [Paramuribaculum sp.]
MKKTLLFLTILTGMGLNAQNHPAKANESKEIHIVMGNAADSTKVYDAFVENAPKRFNIPGAPRFAIVGKDEKFYFGIGGLAKATVSFDFPNPINSGQYFTTANIPMHGAPGNGGLFQINAQQSSLFFNFVAFPGSKNRLGAYINFDLCGNNYTPFLQYAYLTWRDFIVGYNTTLFLDGAASAPTIDKEGPNATTYAINPLVDYAHKFKNGITLAVGAEIGPESFTTTSKTASVNQRIPDIPAYIQYNFKGNPNSYVRFSAILRNMQYRDDVKDKNGNVTGWGIKASGILPASNKFIAYFQMGYGKGITSYFEDMAGLGLDLTPDPSVSGKLEAVKAWGGYIGLQYNFSKKCYSSVTYSQTRNYANGYSDGSTPWDSQYKYGQYLAANVFYNITSQLTWGAEWDWGRRVDMNGLSRHDNRLQTMLQFTF